MIEEWEKNVVRLLRERYSLQSEKIEKIVWNQRRGVWKIKAANRQYVLKHLKSDNAFSVFLLDLLSRNQLSPDVIKTNAGDLFFIENGIYFFLMSWVAGTFTSDPMKYMQAVASFHRYARFPAWFPADSGSLYGPATRKEWLRIYHRKLAKLRLWRDEMRSDKLKAAFVKSIRIGEQAVKDMEDMKLEPYINESLEQRTVVHWDFHRGNILFAGENPKVIDMDSASVSFQVCDIHQVLSDLFDKMAVLPENLEQIFKVYFQTNPHSRGNQHIYFAVGRFPHYFWTMAERRMKYGENTAIDVEQLCKASDIEGRKNELMQRWQ